MKKSLIFKGTTKPSIAWVGSLNKTTKTKDKFGELEKGEIRRCIINTRWGQVRVPFSWIGKKIIIEVRKAKPSHKTGDSK